tara:strand:+ start:1474 stop:2202 length:729 start_codon:yes stop_codon:yes gene_type:complete
MSNKLFENLPSMTYTLNTGEVVRVKDFFRKVKIEKDAMDSLIDYQKYEIQDGERPDVLATNLYGDGDLHWVFWLVNDFDNYYDWFMDYETFENYMNEKYQGQNLVAPNTTDIVSASSKFLIGETVKTNLGKSASVLSVDPQNKSICVLGDTIDSGEVVSSHDKDGNVVKSFTISSVSNAQDGVHHYVDSSGNKRTYGGTGYSPVTHFTKEFEDNEKKRQIKIISPQNIKTVLKEITRLLSDD